MNMQKQQRAGINKYERMVMKRCIVFCGPIFLLPKQIRDREKTNCKQYTAHMGTHIHTEYKCAKQIYKLNKHRLAYIHLLTYAQSYELTESVRA